MLGDGKSAIVLAFPVILLAITVPTVRAVLSPKADTVHTFETVLPRERITNITNIYNINN